MLENFHILACFDDETARMSEIDAVEVHHSHFFTATNPLVEKMRKCRASSFIETNFPAKDSPKCVIDLGDGNAFAYQRGPFCHAASEDGISVLFVGNVAKWPGVDAVAEAQNDYIRGTKPLTEAERLVLYFKSLLDVPNREEMLQRAVESLETIEGSFSFILFDGNLRRVLVARDRFGSHPLYWGVADDGLMCVSTCPDMLSECRRPTAAPFPAGCVYTSGGNIHATHPGEDGWVMEGDQWPGKIVSFLHGKDHTTWRKVQTVPRVDSHGVLCGNVFRVASEHENLNTAARGGGGHMKRTRFITQG